MDYSSISLDTIPEEEIKNIKEYEINSKNQNFKVILGVFHNNTSAIIFQIEELNSINNYYFKSGFSLDELKSMSKLFRIVDSIDELYNELNQIFNKKNVIIELEYDYANLHLILSSLSSQTQEIILPIKKKKINSKIANEVLFREINEIKKILKEEIQEKEKLKVIVSNLIQENKQLKETVNNLLEWKESFDKKDEQMAYEKININSKIFVKNEEISLISKRFMKKRVPKPKKLTFNLLYRASRDGDSPIEYHKKCDGKANTICAIKTKKGCKFGGYTETKIGGKYKELSDPNSFIFSLNKMKIYENKNKNEYAVCHSGTWGPIFRGGFSIADKSFFSDNINNIKSNNNSPFFDYDDDEFEINNGEEFFSIDDFEVFQLLFD